MSGGPVPLSFDRVALLRVARSTGRMGLGSGYLLGERLLLTAAHVVEDGMLTLTSPIDVVFPATGTARAGRPVWSGRAVGLDVALVVLDTGVPAGMRHQVRWGRLTGSQPGIPASAIGFPRAVRADDGRRVPDQPSGNLNPGVAFGDRYDLNLDVALPAPGECGSSEWSGLSGAALFAGEFLVGVITLDVPRFDSGRLSAAPVWRLLAQSEFRRICVKHHVDALWHSVEIDKLFLRPEARLDSPASLLRADTETVRFRGRENEMRELTRWCQKEEQLSVALVAGPGGRGKTRLARNLCESLSSTSWVTGFVRGDALPALELARLADTQLNVLLVMDYAEGRAKQVIDVLHAARNPARSVRLLLLARTAGEWWHELRADLREHVLTPTVMTLTELLDGVSERLDAYNEAVADISRDLRLVPDWQDVDWPTLSGTLAAPDVSDSAFDSALTIQLKALVDLLSRREGVTLGADPEDLESLLLEHEGRYWRRTALVRGLIPPAFQPTTLWRAIGLATLCGAADEETAIASLRRLSGFERKDPEELRGVAQWLSGLYPSSEGDYWGSLQPDRIGEHLVGQVTRDRSGLVAEFLKGANLRQQQQALTVLSRAASHQGHVPSLLRTLIADQPSNLGPIAVQVAAHAAEPQAILSALADIVQSPFTDFDVLAQLQNALPPPSANQLAPLALAVLSKLADGDPGRQDRSDQLADRALALSNMSLWHRAMGDGEEAVRAAAEAVRLARAHAAVTSSNPRRNPSTVGADILREYLELLEEDRVGSPRLLLADRLVNLSLTQEVPEALNSAAEAVEIHRNWVDKGMYSPAALKALSVYASALRRTPNRHWEALHEFRKLYAMHVGLAQQDLIRFGPYLVAVLSELFDLYRRLSTSPLDAAPTGAERVYWLRRLVDEQPYTYEDSYTRSVLELASTYGNASNTLVGTQREDALTIALTYTDEVARRLRPTALRERWQGMRLAWALESQVWLLLAREDATNALSVAGELASLSRKLVQEGLESSELLDRAQQLLRRCLQ